MYCIRKGRWPAVPKKHYSHSTLDALSLMCFMDLYVDMYHFYDALCF